MCEDTQDDWQKSENRARKFEQLYEDGKILMRVKVEQLKEEFKQREAKLQSEKADMSSQFENYK